VVLEYTISTMVPVMNKKTLLLLTILLVVLTSACSGTQTTPTPSSPTPEANISALATTPPPPITISDSDPSSTATTNQPIATLSPVFDLTKTEDNPITDAQQIIEILESLENFELTQPTPVGWYLSTSNDLLNPDNPEKDYGLFHVVDEDLNCDVAMHFQLNPNGDILWWMTRDYGAPIYGLQSGEVAQGDASNYYCNLSNPNLMYFNLYSSSFSSKVFSSPSVGQDGDYTFSAWFEIKDNQILFILKEGTDNIHLGYITDPDSNEQVAVRSEETIKTYMVSTGLIIESRSVMCLANENIIQHTYVVQRDFFQDISELPPAISAYLDTAFQLYDNLQIP